MTKKKKKKIKKDEFEFEIVDKFDDEDFFDDCPVCQAMKFAQEKGRTPTLSELREAHKKAKEKGAIVGGELLEKNDFQMPRWMECTWRRVPCGKDSCPICGRIKKDRQKHIEQGDDPDGMESVLEDVGQNFKKALEIIKKDPKARGSTWLTLKKFKNRRNPRSFPCIIK